MRSVVLYISSWIIAVVIVWIAGQITYDGITQSMIANGAVEKEACVGGAATVGVAIGLAVVGVMHIGIYLAVGTVAGVGIGVLLVGFMSWCPPQIRKPIAIPVQLTAILILNTIATFTGSGILAGVLIAHYLPVCINDSAMSVSSYRSSLVPTIVLGMSLLSCNLLLPMWARAIAIQR